MLCYRCNGTLDPSRDTCSKCGTDIRIYKKIVYASNRYYNEGLIKARARDLTGARDALRKSLHLYKKNIEARNLLGLVEYAMGESAEALKEWVLSKNLSGARKSNIADRFINNLKRNMRELDSEGHGIKKYNQALNYCRSGARDLAVIQLKKVVSVHKNMTKAYELLALLYIEDGKYDQAEKILNQCLQVDRGNPSALYYLKELEAMNEKGTGRSIGLVGEDDREQVIIPVRFRDYGTYLSNLFYIIFGLLVGVLIAWYVIVPGKVEKEVEGVKNEEASYEEKISDLQDRVMAYSRAEEERQAAAAEESAAAETSVASGEETGSEDGEEAGNEGTETADIAAETFPEGIEMEDRWNRNQEAVNECVNYYNVEENLPETIRTFFTINPELLSDSSKVNYSNLCIIVTDLGFLNRTVEQVETFRTEGDMLSVAEGYDAISLAHPEEPSYRYEAAKAYEAAGETDTAANRYWQVVNLFPEYENAEECSLKYMELKGTESVPGLPEGTDAAALTAPVTLEDLLSKITEE